MAVSGVIDADAYRRDNGMAVSGVIDAEAYRRDNGITVSGWATGKYRFALAAARARATHWPNMINQRTRRCHCPYEFP